MADFPLTYSGFLAKLPSLCDPDIENKLDALTRNEFLLRSARSLQLMSVEDGEHKCRVNVQAMEAIARNCTESTVILTILGPAGWGKSTFLSTVMQFGTASYLV